MDPRLKEEYEKIFASELQAREEIYRKFSSYPVEGVPGPNRDPLLIDTVCQWRREQRIFAFNQNGRDNFPAFQFAAGEPKSIVGRILRILCPIDGWHAMFWFAAANAWLDDGKCPVDLLDADPDAVEEAARHANDEISD